MPQRAPLMRPLVVLALPGMYLLYKYNQYRQQQMETARRRVTERELMHLNTKIRENILIDSFQGNDRGRDRYVRLVLAPFRQLRCEEEDKPQEKTEKTGAKTSAPMALPPPERKVLPLPAPRPGVQVAVLGAETPVGQYLAFLLKQCQSIKKLRLYAAKATDPLCNRDLCQVVQDLHHIDTNCFVQAYSCACNELGRSLQNSDVVVMLDDACAEDPMEKRFNEQAPLVKRYADAIANECPKAFIVVCTTPVDCMVPLAAQALKDMGWYNPQKILGSLAVPEMRASTLAARALCLDPSYTKIPCVGGTEGASLVPLFSKAVEYFDFTRQNSRMLTETVRAAAAAMARGDGVCVKAAELSEAHAIAGLVMKISNALLCKDIPRVTGFVQTNQSQVVCSSRFLANVVEINGTGISRNFSLPKMSDTETDLLYVALSDLCYKHGLVADWYCKYCSFSCGLNATQVNFFIPKHYERFDDCAYANM
ncbi:unnamed protein product, partial [Iphiclides podalirius]